MDYLLSWFYKSAAALEAEGRDLQLKKEFRAAGDRYRAAASAETGDKRIDLLKLALRNYGHCRSAAEEFETCANELVDIYRAKGRWSAAANVLIESYYLSGIQKRSDHRIAVLDRALQMAESDQNAVDAVNKIRTLRAIEFAAEGAYSLAMGDLLHLVANCGVRDADMYILLCVYCYLADDNASAASTVISTAAEKFPAWPGAEYARRLIAAYEAGDLDLFSAVCAERYSYRAEMYYDLKIKLLLAAKNNMMKN